MVGLIVGIVLLAVIVFFVLSNTAGDEGSQEANTGDSVQVKDCGNMDNNPNCFISRANECLPVKGDMIATDGTTTITLTVLGIENATCHFQRAINSVIDYNCYFPGTTMNWDLVDQTFGNDKGLQSVIDESCTIVQN